MLLICIYEAREDMYEGNFHWSDWVFYWCGEWVLFEQQDFAEKVSENHWKMTRVIKNIVMPDAVRRNFSVFCCDLKEAFEVYRIVGACRHDEKNIFDLTLDFRIDEVGSDTI